MVLIGMQAEKSKSPDSAVLLSNRLCPRVPPLDPSELQQLLEKALDAYRRYAAR
jgi:hypothetical protein